MAAISQTINNVLGGVSQQPDPVKLPGQVREAVNAYLDPTFGCAKRPGTEYIGLLASSIPATAKWFPIFRDGKERYISCIYKDGSNTRLRVWNADTSQEAPVNILGNTNYLQSDSPDQFETLTINDYTFIINPEREVTMDTAVGDVVDNQALIVVNSVAYNTTYAVDFLRDGDELTQVKVFKASRLEVDPGSWEVAETAEDDQGSCEFAAVEQFVRDGSNGQTGLGFTISTTCTPTLVTTEVKGDTFPSAVQWLEDKSALKNHYLVNALGYANNYQKGSYLYVTETIPINEEVDITVRVEARVLQAPWDPSNTQNIYDISKVEVVEYNSPEGYVWTVGYEFADIVELPEGFKVRENAAPLPAGVKAGLAFKIANVKNGDDEIEYSYKSVYKTNVTLNNGGANWSVGDQVTVTMEGKSYTVTVEDVQFGYSYEAEATATYTTPSDTSEGALDVSGIIGNLTAEISDLADYTAFPVGNVIVVTRTDGRDFNLQTRGGTANTALYGVKDTVNDVSRLPPQCIDGFTLKVSNSDQSDADDYFVKFETEGSIPGQGAWEETVKPGVVTDLNSSTMPHVLELKDNGEFEFRPLSKEYNEKNFWAPRDAGDEKTNPDPTFVGKKIKDAVFYMNRLGFLSEEAIIMSQAGDYFNFFQGSAIAISDADPIDMSVSTTKPAKLKAAVGTPAGLLLFAENSQFLLKSQEVAFGPSTVKMDEITNYAYRSKVHPVETGVSILFPTSADTFSKVFELSVDSLNSRPLVSENTRIIPEYIPPELTWCVSVPNSSLVLMGKGDQNIYCFKFYNTGNERNLAGWTRWKFQYDVHLAAFDHDTGFFVERHGTTGMVNLVKMELLDDPETSPIIANGSKFTPRLDSYIFENEVTITNQPNDRAHVRFPEGYNMDRKDLYLITTSGAAETFYNKFEVIPDSNNGDYIDIDQQLIGTDFIIGIGYDLEVTLPTFFVKEGDQNRADRRYPPMVENMYVDVYLSGRYSVDIQKLGYQTQLVDLDVPRADIYLANGSVIENFSTRAIPIYSRGDQAVITIKGLDPLPSALTSYSWEGHYSTRGIARR